MTVLERLFSRVDKNGPVPVHRPDLGPCWLHLGCKTHGGYVQIKVDGKPVYVHLLSCALAGRPIPPSQTGDHLCRVRHCIRPDHIEPVTFRENVLRGVGPTAMNARRTKCRFGHQLEHLHVGRRDCRICSRRRGRSATRRYRAKRKGVAA